MTSRMQNALRLAKPPANPVGLDRFCELANFELTNCLDWLEAPFPLSYRKKELRSLEQDEYFAPKVYLKSREWFRIEPDDTVNSFSFWYADGSRTGLSSFAYSQGINLVVFVNTERVFTEDNIHVETLINQALQTLKKPTFFESIPLGTDLEVFEGLEDAWEDFDITTVNGQQFIKENYATFRIRFDVVYNTLGCLSCIEPIKPDNKVEREDFTENIIFDGPKYQITVQDKDLNISPAPSGHAAGESTLIQYIDGNGINSINISGAAVINGQADNTKRNVIFWLFNNDLSGDVADKTIVNIITAPLFNPIITGAVVEVGAPSSLKVTFNKPVTIQGVSGLSLNFAQGTPKTITGVSGSGSDELVFTLSDDVIFSDSFSLVVEATNTITSTGGSALLPEVFGVENDLQPSGLIPVFRYNFENENFEDSSGNGNDGTQTGSAYTFSNESITGTKSLDTTSSIESSNLLVPSSSNGSYTRIAIIKYSGANNGMIFTNENALVGVYPNSLYLRTNNDIRATGSDLNHFLNGTGFTDQWFFVAQSYDETTSEAKLYVNGLLVDEGALSNIPDGGGICLFGGVPPNPKGIFRGLVDLIDYYDEVLSDSDILDLYNDYV